jgi:hypothetical protein
MPGSKKRGKERKRWRIKGGRKLLKKKRFWANTQMLIRASMMRKQRLKELLN